MSKVKDLRKQMKKQLKAYKEQIEAYSEQVDEIEAAALKRAQERLVSLVDAIDVQLKVWQNEMATVSANTNGDVTPNPETTALWRSMEEQVKQWLTATATLRMEVGADALWQLEVLRALDTAVGEKLRTMKRAENSDRETLQAAAEQTMDDLKHALERILPD